MKGLVMVPAFCVLHGLQKTSLNFRSRKTILPLNCREAHWASGVLWPVGSALWGRWARSWLRASPLPASKVIGVREVTSELRPYK